MEKETGSVEKKLLRNQSNKHLLLPVSFKCKLLAAYIMLTVYRSSKYPNISVHKVLSTVRHSTSEQ
jgi:hypothetical protein